MSRHAIVYVNNLSVTDATARAALLHLAEHTAEPRNPYRPEDVPGLPSRVPPNPTSSRAARTRSGFQAGRSTAPGATGRTRAETNTCTHS